MLLRPAILFACLFVIPWAHGADGVSSRDKSGPGVASVLAERRAAADAADNAVNAAMFRAAQARAKHNIADRDPESPGGVTGDQSDPKIQEYLKLKDTYLRAIADSKRAGDALRDVLSTKELTVSIEAGESLMADSFAAMAELLRSGEITDSNVDAAKSEVAVTGNNPEMAATYLALKSKYLAGKGRAADARAALERRKAGTKDLK